MSPSSADMMAFFRLAYLLNAQIGGGSLAEDICDSYQNHLRVLLAEVGLR